MLKRPLQVLMLFMLLALVVNACGSEGKPAVSTQPTATQSSSVKATATSVPVKKTPTPTVTLKPHPTPSPTVAPTSKPVQTSQNGGQTQPMQPRWTLLVADDFNGNTLSPTWGTYDGPHGGGKSYYKPDHVRVQDGQVHLSISRTAVGDRPYTSGGMAAFKLAQTYGKYEFRAKLPRGKGVGPYSILWEAQSGHGDVEVDLFESPPVNKDTIYFTNHGNGASSQIQVKGNFAEGFHVFSYEWTPGKLHLSIDGIDQGTLTKNVPNFSMWFALAVSSGDAFTGEPDPTTPLPVSLDVDWVRIYRYDG